MEINVAFKFLQREHSSEAISRKKILHVRSASKENIRTELTVASFYFNSKRLCPICQSNRGTKKKSAYENLP